MNFASMNELDSDGGLLSHEGETAVRDIVQFVAFKDCLGKGYSASSAVAEQVLAEIPNQVLSYFEFRGIKPNSAKR